ncbi:hypothetical protein Tco_1377082 [Tanacetum coccineum]
MGANDYINNYLMPENFPTSRIFTPDQYAAVLVNQFSLQLTTLYKLGARLKPLVDNINSNFTDARFTFINVTSITTPDGGVALPNVPCCQLRSDGQCIPNSTPCANRNLFIWFDGFHPTEIVNTVIATRSYNAQTPNDASPFDIS